MLRPLHPNGQPKADHELSADEQASRKLEMMEEEQWELTRARRHAVDNAALAAYRQAQTKR